MTGQSLIGPEPDRHRPIFSFESTADSGDEAPPFEDPPFYNLRTVQVALGDRLYRLGLNTTEIQITRLDGHTAPLEDGEVQSLATVRQVIVRHLRESGYDVSSLEAP